MYCALSIDTRFYFDFVNWKYRFGFLILLVGLFIGVRRWIYNAIIKQDTIALSTLKNSVINLVILSFILILIYPGVWYWDEVAVAMFSHWYGIFAWQHYWSSLYMIYSLYLIPSLGGATFVQVVVISVMYGYMISTFEHYFLPPDCNNSSRLLCRIGFYWPSILLYDFSKYRNILCAYFELLLLVYLILLKNKKNVTNKDYLVTSVFTIIVGAWRTENIYYIVAYPLLLFFISNKDYWKKAVISLIVIFAVVSVGKKNNTYIGNNNYALLSTLNPVVSLTRVALNEITENEQELLAISKIIDIDKVSATELSGENLYWTDGFVNEYSDDEYSNYLKAFVKLIIRYPKDFMQERLSMFIDTSGLNSKQVNIVDTTACIFDDLVTREQIQYSKTSSEKPINRELRKAVIYLLGCKDFSGKSTPFFLLWNTMIPILMLLFLVIYEIKKNWYVALCLFFCLAKVPIIILTAPGSWFIYYFSVVLIGYVSFFFFLSIKMSKR